MPQNNARQRFNLNIGHAGSLLLGKAADLGLGKFNILHIAGGYFIHRRFNLACRQAKVFRRVIVKFLG